MTSVLQVIEKAYTKVNGEYEAVAESSDDFKTYLMALNQAMEDLAHTPYVKWQIFFDMDYTLPDAIAVDTLFYPMADLNGITIANSPYDHVFLVGVNGVIVDKYKLVDTAMFQSTTSTRVCTIAKGGIYFKAIDSKIVGTTIRIPAYVDPVPYTTGSQQVVIDSVPWLVRQMSASICDASPVPFIARNADKFYKQADFYMKEMRENNRRNQALIIKSLNAPSNHTWTDVLNVMTLQDL